MKQYIKDILILGGLYFLITIPIISSNNFLFESIFIILTLSFITLFLIRSVGVRLSFIENTIKNYPTTSIYLYSVGWIVYFWIVIIALILAATKFFSYELFCQHNDELIKIALFMQPINFILAAIMLTIALIINLCQKNGHPSTLDEKKQYIKDLLILGGLYFLITIPLTFSDEFTLLGNILVVATLAFIFLFFIRILGVKLLFIENITKNQPQISLLLYSVGWMVYFWTITGLIMFIILKNIPEEIINQHEDIIVKIANLLEPINYCLAAILLIAALAINIKKQKNNLQ